MFNKILIANRGEIAIRVIRACKELAIKTVAIYSTADKDSLHVLLADEAICVGSEKSIDSYLNVENIISTAVSTGAEAIHPGFGFLSENSHFARVCSECGIKFIGPDSEVIDLMGNKSKAREMMIEAKVPVVPGSEGEIQNIEEGILIAEEIGYPILIKASSGGGGRGMRVANNSSEFKAAFNGAKLEAKNAFGDDAVYLEKFVANLHHIEFQILADEHGRVIHLGERDCSLQRRNQKVIEESPSFCLSEQMREKMGKTAVRAAKFIKYKNAGTIEFLVSGENYYFIEMNTRIQVEHTITEMVTGIDLIKEQIKIAYGQKLNIQQKDIVLRGHAIECRINAENPKANFRPTPGKVSFLHVPNGFGIRFDSLLYSGYTLSPYYDSMVGKLIVLGENRVEAIKKMRSALSELIIEGLDNNINFLQVLLYDTNFVLGKFDTSFIERHLEELLKKYE